MSERSRKNRQLLLWRMALLALGYALPLGGVALFFVLTGIRSRIAIAERERAGVHYIRQLIEVHDHVVREIWNWRATATSSSLDMELAHLEALEREIAPQLYQVALPMGDQRGDLTAQQLRAGWNEARLAGPRERTEDLVLLVGQLHAVIADTSEAAGLTISSNFKTEYLTNMIAFALPIHLERLLQMDEQLTVLETAADGRERSQVAGVFYRLLEKEILRLERGIRLALEGDAGSAHILPDFHREYPKAAAVFLASVRRLSDKLDPSNPSAVNPAAWQATFRASYDEAMAFWRFSARQLDLLLTDQITQAKRERDTALALAAIIVATLLPLTWLYFLRYVRPVIQDMLDEVREAGEAAARAKNQFLAMMSHEIRTPMNGVIGFANLLGETQLNEQQRDFVRTITSSSDALLTVINDILDYTKLEDGRVELESCPVLLRDVIEDILSLLSTMANAKRLELVYWIEPDVPQIIRTDPTRLRQILLNIAGNAVKFTAKGHVEVLVSLAPSDAMGIDRIAFQVRDTGIGIAPDRLDRLFKPFSQVDSSITRTHGGTGLGLAISHRLVTAMGGEIGVSSEPGQGTEFNFTVPVQPVDPAEEADSGSSLPEAEIDRVLRGRRILVVDDYKANRHLFEKIFEPYGAILVAVESAEMAHRAFALQTFDLAIVDYMMPEMDGITLARKIAPLLPPRRLILVSSVHLAPSESVPELFVAVMTKPLRNQKFLMTVVRVLQDEMGSPSQLITPAGQAEKAPLFALKHPLRVLAVDDNPVNLKVISMMLTRLGYAPVVVDCAAKALERLRTDPFDLVLMDVQMPDMDGLEATRRLRSGVLGPLNQGVRVLALTAGATAEERNACRAAGMDDFISKPVTSATLLEKLAAANARKMQTVSADQRT